MISTIFCSGCIRHAACHVAPKPGPPGHLIEVLLSLATPGGRAGDRYREKVVQQSVISPLPVVLTQQARRVLDVARAYRTARKADARPYTLRPNFEYGIKKGE